MGKNVIIIWIIMTLVEGIFKYIQVMYASNMAIINTRFCEVALLSHAIERNLEHQEWAR